MAEAAPNSGSSKGTMGEEAQGARVETYQDPRERAEFKAP